MGVAWCGSATSGCITVSNITMLHEALGFPWNCGKKSYRLRKFLECYMMQQFFLGSSLEMMLQHCALPSHPPTHQSFKHQLGNKEHHQGFPHWHQASGNPLLTPDWIYPPLASFQQASEIFLIYFPTLVYKVHPKMHFACRDDTLFLLLLFHRVVIYH